MLARVFPRFVDVATVLEIAAAGIPEYGKEYMPGSAGECFHRKGCPLACGLARRAPVGFAPSLLS